MAAVSTGNFRRFERFAVVLCVLSLLLVPVLVSIHPPIRTFLFLQAGVDLSIHSIPMSSGTHSAFSGETDCTPISGLVGHYRCWVPGPG
jgi:hypothetical protein